LEENENLILLLKKGDHAAFRKLVLEHSSMVYNICFNILHNQKDAEDITQEVFITIYTSISSFENKCKLSTWIYRIAVNKCNDYIRKINRKKRFSIFKAKPLNMVSNLETEDLNPAELLEAEEFQSYVGSILQKIPDKQRIAFTLSKMDGFSYKEISEQMNMSLSAVESLIFRARKKIIEEIEKNNNNK